MTYFVDQAGRVQTQTMSKNTQRYYTPKRLISYCPTALFHGQKVGRATQIDKCSTRSQPIKQVFFTVQNNQMYNITGNSLLDSRVNCTLLSAIEK